MAEWVIFDAAFSDIGGLTIANFFGLNTRCISLARDIGWKWGLEI